MSHRATLLALVCAASIPALSLTFACGGGTPAATSPGDKAAVQALHAKKCSGCHPPVDAGKLARARLDQVWETHDKSVKESVTPDEVKSILAYLAAPAGGGAAAPASSGSAK